MIRSLLFAPCERVIVGQEDGAISLISLLAGVTAALPFPHDQIPENAAIPLRWYLLSLWQHSVEDIGSEFTQRVVLESPTGRQVITSDLHFALADSPEPSIMIVRGVVHLTMFPVSEHGTFTAKLFFRVSDVSEWALAADYPIQVIPGPVIDISKSPVA